MDNPTRCKSAPCGRWTFNVTGYCSDECAGFGATISAARGAGIVTPPRKVQYSARPRVRRSSGYIARNGAWIATPEASFRELAADLRDCDRAQRRHNRSIVAAVAASAARASARPKVAAEPRHRMTAADLAPIGDQNH